MPIWLSCLMRSNIIIQQYDSVAFAQMHACPLQLNLNEHTGNLECNVQNIAIFYPSAMYR